MSYGWYLQEHNRSDLQNVFQDIIAICTLVVFNVSCLAYKGEINWSYILLLSNNKKGMPKNP